MTELRSVAPDEPTNPIDDEPEAPDAIRYEGVMMGGAPGASITLPAIGGGWIIFEWTPQGWEDVS